MMKKVFGLFLVSLLCPCVMAVNMPGAPVDYNAQYSSDSVSLGSSSYSDPSNNGGPAQLNSLAMSALKAAENHDNAKMNEYFHKMQELGITGIIQPQIQAKKTSHCPPIKLTVNGRNLSGSLCALTGYVYNGKTYQVGYCK